jgi:coenzyme Q-binding protein COQ10
MPKTSDSKILPYSAQQMYDLVADIAQYPQFIPWCAAARIRTRSSIERGTGDSTEAGVETGEEVAADLVIAFKVFRERFGSKVQLYPQSREIITDYLDGPFKHMHSTWNFTDVEGGCRVDFHVDFEFRNFVLQKMIGLFFQEAMDRIVRAFEARAANIYGAQGFP